MLAKPILKKLTRVHGKENVLSSPKDLFLYSYDASVERGQPDVIVFPTSATQIQAIVDIAKEAKLPFVVRGSATNLCGGTVASSGGIVIELSRMNRILEIDLANQVAVVEPGVFNLDLQNALAKHGYFYAPDPASQKVSTLGGNVGMNAGGPHCLKYGVTTNHVLGLEMVLPNGELIQFGGKTVDNTGYDMVGVMNGSEGTLGIITKLFLRIMPLPEGFLTLLASFSEIEQAAKTVSAIIARGIVPATLEYMDNLCIRTVVASLKVDYPGDAASVLLIEVDGLASTLSDQAEEIRAICCQHSATQVRLAKDETERATLWAGRRGALGAMTRLRPSAVVFDGTVPRNRLPEALAGIHEICQQHRLQYGTLLHAGDGNIHPIIVYDERDGEENKRVHDGCDAIMRLCVQLGGTITGEHGVGLEKLSAMHYLFNWKDLQAMGKLKRVFDPDGLCNPGKALPA